MNYNFTDRTRKVLAMAREAAFELQHDYVGTEHMLLGLLREGDGVGAAALAAMGVEAGDVSAAIEKAVRKGHAVMGKGELPYTSRGKKVLEFAMAEARLLNHAYVGTEHLLLGLLREERGIAAKVLNASGVTTDRARAAVVQLLGDDPGKVGLATPRGGRPADVAAARDSAWYLQIDEASGTPIYEQIIARIEEAVATGRVESGERLPSVRDLAAELEIAPGTVARAYSELEKRGVVQTEGAKGTRVAESRPSVPKKAESGNWLERLLRRTVVAAFHRGASAREVRDALERAMQGILKVL
jgi:DNA-binding transcriptional regulator YhcF (GntR family)